MPVPERARVRLLRLARGLSQDQLAREAGISRQAVTGIESGRWDPSIRVALAIARALRATVEDLFEGPPPLSPVEALLPPGTETAAGGRLRLAEVGGRLVALPLSGAGASTLGFEPADALRGPGEPVPLRAPTESAGPPPRRAMVQPLGLRRPTLLVAGCDPALALLAGPLRQLDPPVELVWWPCGSVRALALAEAGLVHVAGAHLRDRAGSYNRVGPATALAAVGGEIVGFARWRQGWALSPELGPLDDPLAAAAQRGLRLVNREAGAEARRLLDRERRHLGIDPGQLSGYRTELPGHLPVAAAVATGLADLGITTEPAALSLGLAFDPLTAERFDLVLPRTTTGSVAVQGLLRVLGGREMRGQLEALPGYDASVLGSAVASF